MHSQVLLSTMHVQVYTLDRCCEYQRTYLLHARYKMCICAMYTHVRDNVVYWKTKRKINDDLQYTCVYAYAYVYIYVYACIYMYMYVFLYVYMHMCMDMYMCVCVCICVYIYICMYVYIYMYMSLYRMYVQFVSFNIGE